MSWLNRIVNAGVSDDLRAAEVRRVQTINVAALLAIGFNLIFSTIFFVVVDPSGAVWLRGLNIVLVSAYVGSMVLNAMHRTDPAMWLINATGLANVILSNLVWSAGLGSIAYFVILPLAAVLTSREDDLVAPSVFTAGSLAGLAIVVGVDPAIPEVVAESAWRPLTIIATVASVSLFAAVVALYYRRRVERAEAELAEQHARAESLLLNILPESTARRLEAGERVIADGAEDVSVLFADLVGSTRLASTFSPHDLVALLNEVFSTFDDLTVRYGLEKIKTVGDSYVAVGGLVAPDPDHLTAAADLALAMRDRIGHHRTGDGPLKIRIGLHVGPVVAGVIGKRKFSYDLWGDTVNIASRMESTGLAGRIQVTRAVRDRLSADFAFEPRGSIEVKGKGSMDTYLLVDRHPTAGERARSPGPRGDGSPSATT